MSSDRSQIRQWHIVISGFLQTEGKPTGMVGLWRSLLAERSRSGDVVELRAWNDNWRDLAELIWRVSEKPSRIKIYAYSWGAGWGAMQLARELEKRGLCVRHMVLSDPVYRASLCLSRCLALSRLARIKVPANVRRVTWFRQQMNRPMGHRLIPLGHWTKVDEPVVLRRTHAYMDDAPEFHTACERVAAL